MLWYIAYQSQLPKTKKCFAIHYNNQKISINRYDQTQDLTKEKFHLDNLQYESTKYLYHSRLDKYR